jgi:Lon protease-like protein
VGVTETVRIPLFPLGVVLLPGMPLPLHIFEERYKQMIAECLSWDRPFGIVLFDGQSVRSVGCLARIVDVLKRYADGRLDIMTRGGERFVIRELIEEQPYLEARVFFFDDTAEVPDDDLESAMRSARQLLAETTGRDLGFDRVPPDPQSDPQQLAFAIAALDGFAPAERQGFLEMTSPSERLRKCVQTLARIVARNRLTQEIRRTIGGNGHPPQTILDALEDQGRP